jgi:hypothetical protein
MPIRQYLNGEQFDPEATRIMGVAFEVARVSLGTRDRDDIVDETIAKRIIELAKAGERDVDRLCECALAKVSEADGHTSQLFQSSFHLLAGAVGFFILSQSGERPDR